MNDELTQLEIETILNDIVYADDRKTCEFVGIECHACGSPYCDIRTEPQTERDDGISSCDSVGHHQWLSEGYWVTCMECGATDEVIITSRNDN